MDKNINFDKKYYVRKGIEIYEETNKKIHFSSPYTCDKYYVYDMEKNINIILNLSKSKSLREVIRELNYSDSDLNLPKLEKTFIFLIENEIISDTSFNSSLSEEEIEYYSRNIFHLKYLFNQNGFELQEKLKSKIICVVGLGGSGTALLTSLIGLGIGEIRLIDFDNIASHNLPRQFFYEYKDIGKFKTEVMKERIKNLNPFINVKTLNLKITKKDNSKLTEFTKGCDLIINAADEPSYTEVLHYLQNICFKNKVPFMGSPSTEGFIPPLVVPGKTSCIKCMTKENPLFLDESYGDTTSKLNRFLWNPLRAVPYSFGEGIAIVTKEILEFLLFKKSIFLNHFRSTKGEMFFVPKRKDCECNLITKSELSD